MGKWAEVQCVCPNRTPLPGTHQMFECGHDYGVVIEFAPSQIINLGYLLGNIVTEGFEIFRRVGNWRCYEDDLLLIQPDESKRWLIEVDEIRHALDGGGSLPQEQVAKLILEFLRMYLSVLSDLRTRLDEAAATMPLADVTGLMKNVEETNAPDVASTIEKIKEALSDATLLCRASIETRNPIRLLW